MKGGGGGMVPVGCRVTSDSRLREGGDGGGGGGGGVTSGSRLRKGGDGGGDGGGGGGTASPLTRVCMREVRVVMVMMKVMVVVVGPRHLRLAFVRGR
jgi:hypothetical protein